MSDIDDSIEQVSINSKQEIKIEQDPLHHSSLEIDQEDPERDKISWYYIFRFLGGLLLITLLFVMPLFNFNITNFIYTFLGLLLTYTSLSSSTCAILLRTLVIWILLIVSLVSFLINFSLFCWLLYDENNKFFVENEEALRNFGFIIVELKNWYNYVQNFADDIVIFTVILAFSLYKYESSYASISTLAIKKLSYYYSTFFALNIVMLFFSITLFPNLFTFGYSSKYLISLRYFWCLLLC